MTKPKKLCIAVTGANGFVATNVRRVLNEKGIKLVGISRRNFQNQKSEIKIVSPNFDIKKISSKLNFCDALVHLIGTGHQTVNSTFEDVNVESTKKAIQLSKNAKIKKFVYISGLGVSKNSTSSYFISKYKAEQEIIKSGLDYTILRASYIIGKNDHLSQNLNNQIKKKLIKIPGSGKYRFQPIYVNDVAEVIFNSIIMKKFSNKIIDLVGPEIISFKEFVRVLMKDKKVKICNFPLEQAYHEALHGSHSAYGIGDLNIMVGDFVGNYNSLRIASGLKFKTLREVLQSSSLV